MAAEHSTEDGGEVPVLIPNRHDHYLRKFKNRGNYRCEGCKEEGVNSGYECFPAPCPNSGEVCNFHMLFINLKDEEQHPIRTHMKFRFRRETSFSHRCTACDHKLEGYVYETEKMRLHPLCLMLPPELKKDEMSFRLMMSKSKADECYCCKERIEHGWKYISGDVFMDVGCAKYHLHGLSAKGIQSSPVHRKRDRVKDVAKSTLSFVTCVTEVVQTLQVCLDC